MKNKATMLTLVCLSLAACGSSSPEGFVRAQARISCKKTKKCDKSVWSQTDYGSIGECVDDQLEAVEEQFVESCEDFDSAAARKCLAGMRKVKRTCDEDSASSEQEKACGRVCGEIAADAWTERSIEQAIERHAALAAVDTRIRTGGWIARRAGTRSLAIETYATTLP